MRNRLVEKGKAAIDGSNDPMVGLARAIDADWRAMEKDHEEKVVAVRRTYRPIVAQAIFQVRGHEVYPDANFMPRISYGAVKGYRSPSERSTRSPRSAACSSTQPAPRRSSCRSAGWPRAASSICSSRSISRSTNDLIGGFSGSAAVNKAGEVVGVLFDINAQALGGYFGYDPAVNRAVGVSVGAMREALAKVYKADRIVEELK